MDDRKIKVYGLGPRPVEMKQSDWDRFIHACENPKPPSAALIDMVRKYGPIAAKNNDD